MERVGHGLPGGVDTCPVITYDNLERITTAYSSANSAGDCWGQSFGYDRYANLAAISSTRCSAPAISVTVNNKNQVTKAGFTYDNGGRLTADGTYTYAWVAKWLPVVPMWIGAATRPWRYAEHHLASTNGVTYVCGNERAAEFLRHETRRYGLNRLPGLSLRTTPSPWPPWSAMSCSRAP